MAKAGLKTTKSVINVWWDFFSELSLMYKRYYMFLLKLKC